MGSNVTLTYLKAIDRGVGYMEYVEIALKNGQDTGIVRTFILGWLEEYRALIGYDADRCLKVLERPLKDIGDEDGLVMEATQNDEEKLLKKCLGIVDMDPSEVLNSSQRIWQLLDGITDRIGEEDNSDSLLVYTDSFHLIWMALSFQFFSVYRLTLKRLKEEKDCQHFSDNDRQEPDVLNRPEIREEFDKAVKIGLLDSDYNLKDSKMLLACFCWGIDKKYDLGTIAKNGENKGGFAVDWQKFSFIRDSKGKEIRFSKSWQNAKTKNLEGKFNPEKLKDFTFYNDLMEALGS